MSLTVALVGIVLFSCLGLMDANPYVQVTSRNLEMIPLKTYICSSETQLSCRYRNDRALGHEIQWIKYRDGGRDMVAHHEVTSDFTYLYLNYSLKSSGQYACEYYKKPSSTLNITITISNDVQGCRDKYPVSITPVHTLTKSSSMVATATVTATPTHSSLTAHFTGLNPLIYTTVTALLLVVLTLIAIITCWLRSRKISSQRTLLPQESPQDYLDYIREGQFTPLTTSEFLASLNERPPTYFESQDMQRRQVEDGTTPSPPSPVRLRNLPTLRPPPPPPPPSNSVRRGSSQSTPSDDEENNDESDTLPDPLSIPLPDPSPIPLPDPSSQHELHDDSNGDESVPLMASP